MGLLRLLTEAGLLEPMPAGTAQYTGQFYQPTTTAGRYTETMGKWLH